MTVLRRIRRHWVPVVLVTSLLLGVLIGSPAAQSGPFASQIQAALRAFVASPQTITAEWTFTVPPIGAGSEPPFTVPNSSPLALNANGDEVIGVDGNGNAILKFYSGLTETGYLGSSLSGNGETDRPFSILSTGIAASLTTAFADPNANLTFTAMAVGQGGNSLVIEYIDPGGNNQPLTFTFGGDTTTQISLATGPTGDITTTAQDLIDNWETDGGIAVPVNVGDGTGVVEALGATNLSGGLSALNVTGPVGASDGLSLGENYATQGILRLPNDEEVFARNAANTDNIMLLRTNGSNVVEVAESILSLNTITDAAAFVSTVTATGFNAGAAGVSLTGANGVLTLLGLGDGADENLLLDFDNAGANVVGVSSGTGVTKIDAGSIAWEGAHSSSDGTAGITGVCVAFPTVKDGLVVACGI